MRKEEINLTLVTNNYLGLFLVKGHDPTLTVKHTARLKKGNFSTVSLHFASKSEKAATFSNLGSWGEFELGDDNNEFLS